MNASVSESQIVYGRIASVVYARSELNENRAVMVVHNLFNENSFVRSHKYQTLHLGRNLNDINGEELDCKLEKEGGSYFPVNAINNYRYRLHELEHEPLYHYTEKFYTSNTPKRKKA